MTVATVILCDTSGSMAEMSGTRRRIDVLQHILDTVLPAAPDAVVLSFNSVVDTIDRGQRLPEPQGGTSLQLALRRACTFRPLHAVVISDGKPESAEESLDAARELNCKISTYFAGDETDFAAVAFMRALAWQSSDGMGYSSVVSFAKPEALAEEIRHAITGPV